MGAEADGDLLIVAERFSQADILHGPIAMVGAAFPTFLLCPPGVTWPGMKELTARLAGLKAERDHHRPLQRGGAISIRAHRARPPRPFGPSAGGRLYAHPIYRPGSTVRRDAGRGQRLRSRPAARAEQSDAHAIARPAGPQDGIAWRAPWGAILRGRCCLTSVN